MNNKLKYKVHPIEIDEMLTANPVVSFSPNAQKCRTQPTTPENSAVMEHEQHEKREQRDSFTSDIKISVDPKTMTADCLCSFSFFRSRFK